ncbi:MAG: hypothetical protein KY464_14755 [Gemmatimonadetes bacterium]|nr:hypothetical protein [Gemmatimonadota bacterium]
MLNQERDNPELAKQTREERMRYEVLALVCRAARRDPNEPVNLGPFREMIGVWSDELFRVIDFLAQKELVRYCGPEPKVCITPQGIDHLYGAGKRNKAIPDEV